MRNKSIYLIPNKKALNIFIDSCQEFEKVGEIFAILHVVFLLDASKSYRHICRQCMITKGYN